MWRSLMIAIRGVIFALMLGISIIILNVVQVASLVICIFSPREFRRFNIALANFWWGLCVKMINWGGVKVRYSGDVLPSERNAVLIVNHQSACDIPVLFCLAQQKRRLGHLKWFVKDILRYVPGPGWGLQFLDTVFVKRDWTRDKASVQRVFAALNRHNLPFWLISFSEGTRATPSKLARSQAYCRANKKPLLQHVLAPRTKGFVSTIEALRQKIDGVYDVTIAFPHKVPTMMEFFAGKCREVYIHTKRYPVDSLPKSADELSSWVWQRFEEKDRFLDSLYRLPEFGR